MFIILVKYIWSSIYSKLIDKTFTQKVKPTKTLDQQVKLSN